MAKRNVANTRSCNYVVDALRQQVEQLDKLVLYLWIAPELRGTVGEDTQAI